ncbi:hypothetical protein [Pelagibacterium xiamenense]|uniref:hypothetical protein n=1 Tax=Pelagibacterium xiamenense TaxID=2901140 RepID=UPI001E447E1B|nr:hypothetical protein [Pelagibacterium xiamenense]MCD7060669.1 hypothetical protein [Pelagibacterium xiamenense]
MASPQPYPHATPILDAPTPQAWAQTHFAGLFPYHFTAPPGTRHTRVTLPDLLAEDAAILRSFHARLVENRAPAPAAATYMAAWFPGRATGALAYSLIAADAGFLITPEAAQWYLHPGGWPDRFELVGPIKAIVAPDHPWAGQKAVEIVPSRRERHARVMAAAIATMTPLVEALATLSRAKPKSLWPEIADGIASALTYQEHIAITEDRLDTLRALCALPGMPWKRQPHIEKLQTRFGAACATHKSGCCLAYTEPYTEIADVDLLPSQIDYRNAFPEPACAPRYCDTCRFRDRADSLARQLWWREREHADRLEG